MRRSAYAKRFSPEQVARASRLPFLRSTIMHQVHVHLERPTSRARYAAEQLLGKMLGWQVVFVTADELAYVAGPKLNYGHGKVRGAFQIMPSGFLEGIGRDPIEPGVIKQDGIPMLFPTRGGDLPFDPFAAAFFLLSRYEEWSELPEDEHGRPLTDSLHGARHGYLERPVVDEWAIHLAQRWRSFDPSLPAPDRRYRQVLTVDLDNGFKYLGRPLWRTAGSLARDVLKGRWAEVMLRIRVLAGAAPDPYDILEELRPNFLDGVDRTVFFVLAADRGPRDHAVPLSHPEYARRIRTIGTWAEVGVHPSYDSSIHPELISKQRQALSHLVGAPVPNSRQHFLRFKIPGTFRELVRLGFREEHSMGLHDRPGFRAGTCTPYAWYDLGSDSITDLEIHPFAVMDNTLRHKIKYSPEEAVEAMSGMITKLKGIQGTFTGLWHESFLGRDPDNAGWREAILRIIANART